MNIANLCLGCCWLMIILAIRGIYIGEPDGEVIWFILLAISNWVSHETVRKIK